ncbi:MAG TPA: type II toxin-antitoxin system VapC family toxin [Xanthomonadales bacterium]|nr:type II toxin-antitoxin system VapC family toxin [Xanthomonadales bacterium]
MVLADTSIWIDHLRKGEQGLAALLEDNQVLVHPFVVGELACGNLRNRQSILAMLQDLPAVTVATDAEVLAFIEAQSLMARGIGYIDAHLLASVALSPPARLWTRDKALLGVAQDLGQIM